MSVNNKMKKIEEESFGRFDFVKNIGIFGGISLLLVVFSLLYIAIKGINYGIDFKGGTEVQVKFAGGVTIDQVRELVAQANLGDTAVQSFSEGNEFTIRFQGLTGATDKETNELLQKSIVDLRDKINTTFATSSPEIRRVDSVGPQVGAELKRNGFLAVFYCLLVILIYVAFRFDPADRPRRWPRTTNPGPG